MVAERAEGIVSDLCAPFPWFGGKRRVADVVWRRFGDVLNYVEPFFGSGAVLLGRPHEPHTETVNDLDGFVANFWRAVRADPAQVAQYADWPVNEADLHARHSWLVGQRATLSARLCGDPDFCDSKIAGWWVWGMACWIGGGFCSGAGPWVVRDGALVHRDSASDGDDIKKQQVHLGGNGQGVQRKIVHLGGNGRGVQRKIVHLGGNGQGVQRKIVHLGDDGRGVQRKIVHLGDDGRGEESGEGGLIAWMQALSERLQRVRVCCGEWDRICGPSVTVLHGTTAVFLDPPYSDDANRDMTIYSHDSGSVAHRVREWCHEWGTDKRMRIALCGYAGEHEVLADAGWVPHAWKSHGGYGNQGNTRGRENAKREVIWFSPHCLHGSRAKQLALFAEDAS